MDCPFSVALIRHVLPSFLDEILDGAPREEARDFMES